MQCLRAALALPKKSTCWHEEGKEAPPPPERFSVAMPELASDAGRKVTEWPIAQPPICIDTQGSEPSQAKEDSKKQEGENVSGTAGLGGLLPIK